MVDSTFLLSGGGDIARVGEAVRFTPPPPAILRYWSLEIILDMSARYCGLDCSK